MNYKFSRLLWTAASFCVVCVSFGFLSSVAFSAGTEDFGPYKYDGGKIACDSDTGPEIKQTQTYKTTADRFFVDDSIKISEISGWGNGNPHGCDLTNVKKKKITVKSEYGPIQVDVISEFSLYAHADCGSGVWNNSGGKTASVECSVFAKTQKYSNQ